MTNTEIIAKLREARQLIAMGWVKKWFAVDSQNRSVDMFENTAVKFCLGGSLRRLLTYEGWPLNHNAFILVENKFKAHIYKRMPNLLGNNWPISCYNDHPNTKQEDILSLFDEVIQEFEVVS